MARRRRALNEPNWETEFTGLRPIELADGAKLCTLSECRTYIADLPLHEQRMIAWRGAAVALAKAAELGGPHLGIARAAVCRALAHKPSVAPGPTREQLQAAQRARWKARKAKLSGST